MSRRSYDEIEALAAQAEATGGYARIGAADGEYFEVLAGDERTRIEGEDRIDFLMHMLRRSQDREAELRGVDGYDHAEREQVRRDARREVLEAANEAMERFR
jgi:hypothetical protein